MEIKQKACSSQHPAQNIPRATLTSNHKNYKQTNLQAYLITPPKPIVLKTTHAPLKQTRPIESLSFSPIHNLANAFESVAPPVNQHQASQSITVHKSRNISRPESKNSLKHTILKSFFSTCSSHSIVTSPPQPVRPVHIASKRTKRQILLSYNRTPITLSLVFFSKSYLDSIDSSTVFRITLQNPNRLQLSNKFHITSNDFQKVLDYGAAAFLFLETNINWSQKEQRDKLKQVLRDSCTLSSLQTSRLVEPFLSSYQPGGTATILTNRWTSRIISRGEDPLGLGRWSYITLRGKQE